ncbi:ABC transporter ATP-binding protein [Pseudoruegeria sp. SK021]|uniref:ABC transporter ATP-binding protein n=1 Tax=Pseudoruegeria sp. SK021 TaxID=1933035 RepID=UPI000A220CB7|nr:oligopeptide/dipeptide ABC transporter ATP-binding protein [Pseudoruegeria sp. SK021]OSP54714.1 peptide ABC transporter substrate-binding protein [Pseudoruegeria sp. SK021]
MTHPPLVEARNLSVEFHMRRGLFSRGPAPVVQAVRNMNLSIQRGETLALVGESGCGKSTLGRAMIRTAPIAHGELIFDGKDITTLAGETLRRARSRFQMIFQDPYSSLNPKARIFDTLAEPLRVHTSESTAQIRTKVSEMLEAVGLDPTFAARYPHEFSGGQRQRIAIARAVIVQPDFIVADEPLSALDVSMQLQILKLFDDLRDRFSLTYLFISHDLARVFSFADRVAVMYLGKLVEIGTAAEITTNPRHPYTKALLAAAPSPDPTIEADREVPMLSGDIPSPAFPPPGCRFHTRCPIAMEMCKRIDPEMTHFGNSHMAACHAAAPGLSHLNTPEPEKDLLP